MANPQTNTLPTDIQNLIGAEPRRDGSDQQLLQRFISHCDEEAFAGLVQRHGNTVWGVCRRVLHQTQDVEDAFQAVFLILARKAASIRKGEAVGSWLHGVAYHTAMKALRSAARRQHTHKQARPARTEPPASSEASCRELQRILDEEVQRLAAKYRAPFVLCCLEGMSRAEAAQELGWKEGTVSGRLAQARKLLQSRLLRRGITVSAALTAAALAQGTASAAAPAALIQTTSQAVLLPESGHLADSTLSPAVRALAESLLRGMARSSVTMGVTLLLGLALLIAGASLAATQREPDSRKRLTVQASAVPMATRPAAPGRGPAFDSQVVALAFSPDGKRLVTAGARAIHPGHLKICDVETARELVTLGGVPGTSSVAFSPDGKSLASGEFSGRIKLRDPATGQERASWNAHPTGVSSVAFAPDGAALLSCGTDGTARLWDVKTLQERQVFQGHTEEVVAAAYFHHGKGLVTASRDQTAILWDVQTGQQRFTLRGHEESIEALAVSPDDKLLATAGRDSTVRLWDSETGQTVAVLKGTRGPVSSVAFSPDGKLLAAAADRTIRFWNVQTHQRVASLARQAQPITTLAFSPTGNYLANGCAFGLMLFALQVDGDAVNLRKEPAQEYSQSLKGAENCQGLELYGPDAGDYVRYEPEGLRITLPAGVEGQTRDRGVGTTFPVKGDFEITVRFEILKEPRPAETVTQTRFSLALFKDWPKQNMAFLSRNLLPRGSLFSSWARLWDEQPGKPPPRWDTHDTQATTGQLRLVRTGSLLSSYYAEGLDAEFTLLQQYPFGTEDLKAVRLVASTGGPQAAVDVRLTDFRIRSGSIPDLPSAPVSAPAFRWRVWLAGAILGLAILLLLGLWLLRRRRGLAEPESEPVTVQDEPAAVEPAMAGVSFPCSECGKGLKTRAELAGKKVKCSGCGKAVLVPHREA